MAEIESDMNGNQSGKLGTFTVGTHLKQCSSSLLTYTFLEILSMFLW